jgi:murein hydrolase activator
MVFLHGLKFLFFLLTIGLLAGVTLPVWAAKSKHLAVPATAEVVEKQNDLKDLRDHIELLRQEMAGTESTRSDVADQLRDAEREVSLTQRELHHLARSRNDLQSTLKDLGSQSRELESRLSSQQSQLEQLIHRQYQQGNPDALRFLLSGNDPNQLARDLHYLAAIGLARSRLLREVESSLQRKQALAAKTRARAEQLVSVEVQQKEQHAKLLAQREQRKTTLDKISAKIIAQRHQIGSLQRDEKQLSQLIGRLAKIIAEKPVPHKEAVRKEIAQIAPRAESEVSEKRPPTESDEPRVPEAKPFSHFVQLKGKLRLPTKGVIGNRFGAARQEGSRWKGLFIRAGTGSDVKAIAGGRVVFAEWMRGFGNLLIVDHGSSYLSIYGNNDALLKQVGEAVRTGEAVATVGNSGGNPESGLYFELRHQGQPLDPLKWVNIR